MYSICIVVVRMCTFVKSNCSIYIAVPIVEDVRQLIYRLKLEMCEASACPKWYLVMKDKDAKESVKFKEFIAPCYVRRMTDLFI